MELITSRTNSKIKNVVNLVKSKKERSEQNLFVLEGKKLFEEVIKHCIPIKMIFVTQNFFEKNKNLFNILSLKNEDIFIITYDICKKISNNITPQEIFVVCNMPAKKLLMDVVLNETNVLMVADLQDVGNFGTIIRTASALGLSSVIVSKSCPDIYSSKVLRASMGAMFNIDVIVVENIIEAIELFKNNNFTVYASALSENCEDINHIVFCKKNLLVVGNEGNGLSEEILKSCNKSITIPMMKGIDSLNVSVATGILLWKMLK